MKGREEPEALKPYLGLWSAVAINVGAIIGGGIFVVTGITAGLAGSALVVSMVVAAVISVFTALSFVELTAWQPVEGSVYAYAYQLVSPFAGFLTGWMWLVSNTFAGAAVALGCVPTHSSKINANIVTTPRTMAMTCNADFFGSGSSF